MQFWDSVFQWVIISFKDDWTSLGNSWSWLSYRHYWYILGDISQKDI